MKKSIQLAIPVIAAALILMWYAFYNGYPLVTGDTGAYVRFAFDFQVLKDRSSFYSIWLAVAGLRTLEFAGARGSLWMPVFFSMFIVGNTSSALLPHIGRCSCQIIQLLVGTNSSGIFYRSIFYSSVYHARYICGYTTVGGVVILVR